MHILILAFVVSAIILYIGIKLFPIDDEVFKDLIKGRKKDEQPQN